MIVQDQTEVVEFLSSPESHSVKSPVRRSGSHGSMVFLAGDWAVKLKRAVYFDYMDYSTVSRRVALEQLAATLGVRFSGVWPEAPKASHPCGAGHPPQR